MTSQVWREERLLVNGKLVEAEGGATFDNVDPATEAVLGVVADGSAADMDAAIAAARVAFDETRWATDLGFRVRCLRQLHDALAAPRRGAAGHGRRRGRGARGAHPRRPSSTRRSRAWPG